MRPARSTVLLAAAVAVLAGCDSAVVAARPTAGFTPRPSKIVRTSPQPEPTPRTTSSSEAGPTSAPRRHPTRIRHVVRAEQLPLTYSTATARQVITVVAGARSDTQGTVRAWRKVPGGWRPVGPPLPAWLGSDGMTPDPNEALSAVPMGSFTLTQAFGHDPNPGTALPYRQTTPADWWISQPGRYYNTEQRCAYGCPFTQGDPNEHLYYETPYYNYAVVIDYNTRNSPSGVRQGAGSAFFLHVTVGQPTQGCVAIDQTQLVRILRWLRPSEHPRILIGLAGS